MYCPQRWVARLGWASGVAAGEASVVARGRGGEGKGQLAGCAGVESCSGCAAVPSSCLLCARCTSNCTSTSLRFLLPPTPKSTTGDGKSNAEVYLKLH